MNTHPAAPDGLLARLAAAPGEFDFVQAVDVLEQRARVAGTAPAPLGRGGDPAREALRLETPFEFAFRPPAVEAVDLAGGRAQARVRLNYLGLAGHDGPLPPPYVELVRAASLARDGAPADFLGMFQHRLLAYGYRAAHEVRAATPFSAPGQAPAAAALRALAGTAGADAHLAALLDASLAQAAQGRRSLHGLCLLLGRWLGVTPQGRESAGRWLTLPPLLRTTLGKQGRAGRNIRLGRGAVLGKRCYQPDGAIELDFGTLAAPLYHALLPPAGELHRDLASLCAWYLGPDIACRVKLACVPEGPHCRLGRGAALGHASWAGAAPARLAARFTVNAPPGAGEGA